jgi:hypothetical protein
MVGPGPLPTFETSDGPELGQTHSIGRSVDMILHTSHWKNPAH